MNIAICDDDKTIVENVKKYIADFNREFMSECSIDSYFCGEDFIKSNKKYDIVFMDIFMNELTGIDVLKQTSNEKAKSIVFMTTSRDFAIDAFNFGALHYLVKPFTKNDVQTALDRCMSKIIPVNEPVFNTSIASGIVAIPYTNLIYIESLNKKTIIHTKEKILTNYVPLDTIMEQLDCNQFMRAQRSFIINMANIADFHYDHITLDNGQEITLSRINQSELKKQYQDYLFKLARRV